MPVDFKLRECYYSTGFRSVFKQHFPSFGFPVRFVISYQRYSASPSSGVDSVLLPILQRYSANAHDTWYVATRVSSDIPMLSSYGIITSPHKAFACHSMLQYAGIFTPLCSMGRNGVYPLDRRNAWQIS